MKIVIFGLTVSSSWGNGHATLWRALCASLARRGHRVVFFERYVPYYAANRDLSQFRGKVHYYHEWAGVLPMAKQELADADAGIVTSRCPDGIAASDLVFSSKALRVFYDLDTRVTLRPPTSGEGVDYIGPRGLQDFDLVLSYTGGGALDALRQRFGAGRVAPLYGSVDPAVHRPAEGRACYGAYFSYLGAYAENRMAGLKTLFVEPARHRSGCRFVIGGSMYEAAFPWLPNIYFVQHVPPSDHAKFYCSARLTLNLTRAPIAEMGFCPSAKLFEAAACGAPVLSDTWQGMEEFFEPGREILLAQSMEDTLAALDRDDLATIARAARQRVLDCHTSDIRARKLEEILESVFAENHSGRGQMQPKSVVGVL